MRIAFYGAERGSYAAAGSTPVVADEIAVPVQQVEA